MEGYHAPDGHNAGQGEQRTLTLKEKAEALGLKTYDTSLPQAWVDALKLRIGWSTLFQDYNPYGEIVWCYDLNSNFGFPVALTAKGALALDFGR